MQLVRNRVQLCMHGQGHVKGKLERDSNCSQALGANKVGTLFATVSTYDGHDFHQPLQSQRDQEPSEAESALLQIANCSTV